MNQRSSDDSAVALSAVPLTALIVNLWQSLRRISNPSDSTGGNHKFSKISVVFEGTPLKKPPV
jgi:hypothetical protein